MYRVVSIQILYLNLLRSKLKKYFPIGGPKNGRKEEHTEYFFNKDTGNN